MNKSILREAIFFLSDGLPFITCQKRNIPARIFTSFYILASKNQLDLHVVVMTNEKQCQCSNIKLLPENEIVKS